MSIKSIDECVKIKQLVEGNELYHYTSAAGIMGIIEFNKFWVSRSNFLNDESELNYIYEVIERVCKKNINDFKAYNQLLETIQRKRESEDYYYESLENRMKKGYYILSFSTRKDSITLWSEYSNFRGYSMAFDYKLLIERILTQNPGLACWHGQVIYDTEEQDHLIIEALLNTRRNHSKSNLNNRDFERWAEDFMKICTIYSMFFKKECFKEECEYRIVFLACHETCEKDYLKMNFREKEGILIPYIEIDVTNNEQLLPMLSLIVAPKNSMNLGVRGITYFLQSKGYSVPVIKSNIPLRY